ncbi:MAG TPA: VOC family protein [Gemmatimonadales bacterium]|nr:VOC family protein [Gemmatimonadales bacterium]
MITGVAQIALVVHDLEKAVAFYRDTLGLTLLFQVPSAAFFDCGGTRLMLALPDPGHPELDHPPSIVYFRVADIAATCGTLQGRGARLEGEPHVVGQFEGRDVWLAHFYDNEGNLHALTSEAPRGK